MRHRKSGFRVGRRVGHVRSLLANQVCSLILNDQIQTTVTKAKEVRRIAEKMVTLGKKGTLHHKRQAIAKLHQTDVVHKLFEEVAPRYLERHGGYTRIIRLGTRRGDAAEMCQLEFVGNEAKIRERKVRGKKGEAATPAPVAEAPAAAEAASK